MTPYLRLTLVVSLITIAICYALGMYVASVSLENTNIFLKLKELSLNQNIEVIKAEGHKRGLKEVAALCQKSGKIVLMGPRGEELTILCTIQKKT